MTNKKDLTKRSPATQPTKPKLKLLLPSWKLLPICNNLVNRHIVNVIFLVVLPNLLSVLSQVYDRSQNIPAGEFSTIGLAVLVTAVLWFVVNQGPLILFVTKAAQGKDLSLGECYRFGLKYSWPLFCMEVILFTIIFVGLVLLIVPGLIAIVIIVRRYYLAPYFLVDQNLGIKQAFEQSRAETAPHLGYIYGIIGVQIVLTLAGALIGIINPILNAAIATFVAALLTFLPALRYQEITNGILPTPVN